MTECYFEIQGEKLLWFLLAANFRFHWTSIACLACPVTSQLFDFISSIIIHKSHEFFYTVFYHYCTPMQPLFGLTPAAHKLEVKACLFCCTTSCSSCWGEAVVCNILLRKFHIYFLKSIIILGFGPRILSSQFISFSLGFSLFFIIIIRVWSVVSLDCLYLIPCALVYSQTSLSVVRLCMFVVSLCICWFISP